MFTQIQDFLRNSTIFAAVLIIIIVSFLSFIIFDIVKVGERQAAVITRFGKVVDVKKAGWHVKIPIIESSATYYDLGVNSISSVADAATKDQQTLNISVNTQFRIDSSKIEDLYKLVKSQEDLNDSIIPPFIQESVKASSTKFTAAELVEKRDVFKTEVQDALSARLEKYYSNVVSVNIENIEWSENFNKAIKAKVIAEQSVLASKQELERQKIQAEIEITKATAEAEATRIRGEALKTNPETLEKAKIDKWDGKLPQYQGSGEAIINLQ